MLRTAKTIAVVGMSDKPWRASHNIGRYLAGNGYRVFPVNPALTEISGMPCYPTSTLRRPRRASRRAAESTWWMSSAPPNMCPPSWTT